MMTTLLTIFKMKSKNTDKIMSKNNQAFEVALAAVEQLSPKQQKRLTEQLIETIMADENTAIVYLRRLPPEKQASLAELMDKNNEGLLSHAEQSELEQLGSEVDQIMLANSYTLARALRPELFNEHGRPIKNRFRQALSF
jgi:hypothetical protein